MVVLGGGPAGCATALALRRRGVADVVLVEAGDYEGLRVGETVPPEIRLLLDRLGLWEDFLADGHDSCLGSCSLWGGEAPGYNDFLLNPHGTGWHLDRRRFDALLAHKAEEAGVELWCRTRFEGVEPGGDGGFVLRLASPGGPRPVRARFVVDATGGRSRFACAMGAQRRLHDRLGYVAAFLDLPASSAMSRLTLLEAAEYGWWYAARLPGGRVTVAVATDPELIRHLGLYEWKGWRARLGETRFLRGHLEGWEDRTPAEGGLAVRTAPSFRLDPPAGHGWLAVGDAASSYDPIASQGIYKALLDGLEAADAIDAWLAGDAGGLDAYRDAVAARFEDYLGNREYLYGLERRWPSAPFWARRRARTAAG